MKTFIWNHSFLSCRIIFNDLGVVKVEILERAESSPAVDMPKQELPAFILRLEEKLKNYCEGQVVDFQDVPLADLNLTPFSLKVYEALRTKVPFGKFCTYSDLSTLIKGNAKSSRAIGMAMSKNPWPILIPCHRVVGKNGALTGFSAPGGTEKKKELLDWERAVYRPL